ncbi:ABC transporter ATP-binding protein [Bosea sp. RAF48]|uniref:ABC transporter ATP-binding protein n=1 Tax=Bosea sp. RAF48 TaxID=3237480 RepID=UPI003F92CF96
MVAVAKQVDLMDANLSQADRAAPPSAVSIRAVSKSFGQVKVLRETDLDIRQGEFFSLLGSSGCGKTTLLRMIGGFETPTSGDISISGRSVIEDPPYRRRTNMIFQHLALFPHMTVAENIGFGLEMKKLDARTIARKVDEALALVRLSEMGGRKIDALSGGQKQRIAMARALVNEPDVLLLDEPLGALDLQLRLQMQDELKRLHRETGRTFIFVTHDQTEAMTMSDRIAVMGNGRIIQVGTPEEVYERPNSRFVAQFMGHSNFLEGSVHSVGPDRVGMVTTGAASLTCRIPPSIQPGQKVLFALRYEKLDVTLPRGGRDELVGTVVSRSYMGATVRYEMRTDDGTVFLADTGHAAQHFAPKEGDRVAISWSVDAASILAD